MAQHTKLGSKVKAQIRRFAGRLTAGWGKVRGRFVGEMLYGIQASKDVKLSNVSRSLSEQIPLIKTENRLSRNLAAEDLTGPINKFIAWEGAGQVDEETVLAVDISDIRKEYAKKMEYLARVRDGSTGELANGYWLVEVVGAHPYRDRVTPLYGELYSQNAEGFESENAQLLRAIRTVTKATEKQGIVAIDRGGDRRSILIPLIDDELQFVVRQNGGRHVLMPGGEKRSVATAARWCRTTVKRDVSVDQEGYQKIYHLRLGSMPVRLPDRPDALLWLVVIRGFGKVPIQLLTNVPPSPDREHSAWIADVYLTRWKCEEAYRFLKQSYHLEDVRVRSYVGLRNLYVLVHAVMYFVSAILGAKAKLSLMFKKLCEKARRFYAVPPFFHYAVADAIHRLLFGSRTGPQKPPPTPRTDQLRLRFARPPT